MGVRSRWYGWKVTGKGTVLHDRLVSAARQRRRVTPKTGGVMLQAGWDGPTWTRRGFTEATIGVLRFWIVVGDRGPLCDNGRH
jgi:hypothetical protein